MRYLTSFTQIALISTISMAFSLQKAKPGLTSGCESYYRVTGEIAGCTDISTENIQKLWLEKYSICLEIQLLEEISTHKRKMAIYYANPSQSSTSEVTRDSLSSTTSSRQSISDWGDVSFCNS